MTHHPPQTTRTRRRFSSTQRVSATPEAIFPLLCPVREYDWIPGWDCRLVYTESGLAEPGCVFQTNREADGGLDTWVIGRHEPSRHVGFVRINGLRAIRYDISLEPVAVGLTELTWTQEITALSDEGDQHVAALSEQAFTSTIAKIEQLLNEYLADR